MLIPVILCGGGGRRLWPVSRSRYPKQFHQLCGEHTLLQQTALRLARIRDAAAPLVVCNEEHRFAAAEQLRRIGIEPDAIVLEQEGRNTAPAVALAALHVLAQEPDAVLVVCPADHVIRDEAAFIDAMPAAVSAARAGALVTFGVPAERPETGFGYIRVDASAARAASAAPPPANAVMVQAFVEKPDAESAREYVAAGNYYWNSGMFVFRASRLLEELERFEPELAGHCRDSMAAAALDREFVRPEAQAFARCRAVSIDYAVMERTAGARMVPLAAGWSDVGSWHGLWEALDHDPAGNAASGDVVLGDTCDSLVRADARLVSVQGLRDVVVVETDDAVLVTTRESARQVGELVDALRHQGRPEIDLHREVFRPWGSFKGLEQTAGCQVKRLVLKPGARISLQLHHHRAEHWVVVQGSARVTRGDDVFDLYPDQSTFIPSGTRHQLENAGTTDLMVIEVQTGRYFGEDDIVRFKDDYGRV